MKKIIILLSILFFGQYCLAYEYMGMFDTFNYGLQPNKIEVFIQDEKVVGDKILINGIVKREGIKIKILLNKDRYYKKLIQSMFNNINIRGDKYKVLNDMLKILLELDAVRTSGITLKIDGTIKKFKVLNYELWN